MIERLRNDISNCFENTAAVQDEKSCKQLRAVVYTRIAAVYVTRGSTGPDRYNTLRGIKAEWV